MVSGARCHAGSLGKVIRSASLIWRGDQSRRRSCATTVASPGDAASREGWGRRARCHVRSSATAARYARESAVRAPLR